MPVIAIVLTHLERILRQSSIFILVVCLTVSMQGCVSLSFSQISFPYVEKSGGAKLNRKGVLELQGLTLSIRPQNVRSSVILVGVIVPFLPFPGIKIRESENFRIYLQLEALEDGFSLDPAQVKIRLNEKELNPLGYLYIGTGNVMYAKFALSPSIIPPGHDWYCNDSGFDPKKKAFLDFDKIPVREPSGSERFYKQACFVLEYPITTPSPKEKFTVVINGIKQLDRPIQVPPISFHRQIRIKYEFVPLQ